MYVTNNNSGYLNGDPKDYLYMDISDAKNGIKEWLTYDEMRKRASGEVYDCFTDETCYGYNWDYDTEHFIPALKEYADKRFYNDTDGVTDYYGAFKNYCDFYGEYPDFEDDEWWDSNNEIMGNEDDEYHYYDDVVEDAGFQDALFSIIVDDSDLQADFSGTAEEFESACDSLAHSPDSILLLRPLAANWNSYYRVNYNNNIYYVDADSIWDAIRYW